ncbi:unnamed protein product [Penicillium viridicatum]
MAVTKHLRDPPPLGELAAVIEKALLSNFKTASATVTECPDLKQPPFNLAASGLSGSPRIADIGGQRHLFPRPILNAKYSLVSLAQDMEMSPKAGFLLGAGAAPFQDIGQNAELAPNLSWRSSEKASGFDDPSLLTIENGTRVIKVQGDREHTPLCDRTSSTNCALMVNLFGSDGDTGPVLKITAKARKGEENFTDCIRYGLQKVYGDSKPISLVCLTVMHSSDPEGLGLRMEHTHCFGVNGTPKGGHYHYDIQDGDEVEYEAYFNVASVVYRVDRPGV